MLFPANFTLSYPFQFDKRISPCLAFFVHGRAAILTSSSTTETVRNITLRDGELLPALIDYRRGPVLEKLRSISALRNVGRAEKTIDAHLRAIAITRRWARTNGFTLEERFDRTLIYPAATQASEQVVFVGDRGVFAIAVEMPPTNLTRNVNLASRMRSFTE